MSYPLKLEFQAIVKHLLRELGINPGLLQEHYVLLTAEHALGLFFHLSIYMLGGMHSAWVCMCVHGVCVYIREQLVRVIESVLSGDQTHFVRRGGK